eukprot:gene11032-3738_t
MKEKQEQEFLETFDSLLQFFPTEKSKSFSCILEIAFKTKNSNFTQQIKKKLDKENIKNPHRIYETIIDKFISDDKFNEALEVFEEYKKNFDSLDVSIFNKIIKVYVSRQEMIKSVEVYKSLKKLNLKPDDFTFHTIINGFFNKKQYEKGLQFYEYFKQHNLKPNSFTYTILIKGYSKMRKMDEAVEIFNQVFLFKKKHLNVAIFNSMIHGFCNCQRIDEAVDCFETLKNLTDIEPDIITFTTLIRGLLNNNDSERAIKYFLLMKENSMIMDTSVYNMMIKGLFKMNSHEEGMTYFQEMKGNGLKPDIYTYEMLIENSNVHISLEKSIEYFEESWDENDVNNNLANLISIIQRCFQNELTEKAIEYFEKYLHLYPTNAEYYETIIVGLMGVGQFIKSSKYFKIARTKNIELNYSDPLLLERLLRDEGVDEAIKILRKTGYRTSPLNENLMISKLLSVFKYNDIVEEFYLNFKRLNNGKFSMTTFKDLMAFYLKQNKMEKARDILNAIEKHHQPTIQSYNIMLMSYFDKNDLENARKLLKRLELTNLNLNGKTFSILIINFCNQNEYPYAKKYFDSMINEKITPDVQILKHLIMASSRLKLLDDSLYYYSFFQNKKTKLNLSLIIINSLLKGLRQVQMMDKAEMVYHDMLNSNLKPNTFTFYHMIKGYYVMENFEKVQFYIDLAKKECFKPLPRLLELMEKVQ